MADPLVLTGAGLSAATLAAAARDARQIALDPAGLARMSETHALVQRAIETKTPVYGVTTGLGARSTEALDADALSAFSLQTLRGRAHAIGPKAPPEMVRAALIVRLNAFQTGYSAARPEVAQHIATCLNAGLTPVTGLWGSVGVADLLPNAMMALALVGEGEMCAADGTTGPSEDMMRALGMSPLTLAPRDGLALASHSGFTVGAAALAVADAAAALQAAQTAAAFTMEGFRANLSPTESRVLAVKPHVGQRWAGEDLRARLAGSALFEKGAARRLQDPLSLRNVVHIHGPVQEALMQAQAVLEIEINGSSDNPVALAADGEMVSNGAYFTGEIALSVEALSRAFVPLAMAQLARITKLQDPQFSGLPLFLSSPDSASAGLAPLTKTAEVAVAKIVRAAQPTPVWPSLSANGVEDGMTHAPTSIEGLAELVGQTRYLSAIEMLVAAQAIDLRGEDVRLGPYLSRVHAEVRDISPILVEDRPLGQDVERLASIDMWRVAQPDG
ncbi:MAG: histidine ammonia-lyase [Rhodobacteraceae bacterium]|nr:histidine ammonia-lyase [Paracoccaceae bacterium]